MELLQVLIFVGLLITAWVSYSVVHNLFISPLSAFPGPKLWAISTIPYQLSILRGRNHLDMLALHGRYGPVLRVSPKELAFNSPQAFRDIYGVRPGHKKFLKERTHYLPPMNGIDHVQSTVDEGVHARHRKIIAPAFSERALKEQEKPITGFVNTLVRKLREKVRGDPCGKVDIKSWCNFTTFDILGDLMFGESFGCLEESHLHPWIDFMFDAVKWLGFMSVTNQFPILKDTLKRCIPQRLIEKGREHFQLSARKVDRRLSMGTDRPDFVSAILKNGLREKEGGFENGEKVMSRGELHSNGFILIIAGSETSATCLSGCIFYLCKSPASMNRLCHDIRSAFAADEQIKFSEMARLQYLNAVIKESLRMYPPLTTSLPRAVPLGGDTVDGHWIPESTIVACHHYASYHSPANFSTPDNFIPERWLDVDGKFASDKKDVLQPFSLGLWDCLGQALAYAEIRLILCKLLFNFDLELCEESANWTDQKVYFMWDKPAMMIRLKERINDEGFSD